VGTNADAFRRRGPDWAHAYELMHRRCGVPPSIEVFEQELADRRKLEPRLTAPELAERLAAGYRRIDL
jgi:hypothetical protein